MGKIETPPKLDHLGERQRRHSDMETANLGADDLLQLSPLVEGGEQLLCQPLDLLVDGFAVVLGFGAPTYRPGVSA